MKITQVIRKLRIRDEGIIKKADIEFKPGLNIITGPSGSGKTTVLRYIEKMYNAQTIEEYKKTCAAGEKISMQLVGLAGALQNKCILIDDFGRLDRRRVKEILNQLSDSGIQSIITLNSPRKIQANIINTKEFELER